MSLDLEISPEDLEGATPSQLERIRNNLRALKALDSPLDYALYVSPKAKRFPHTEYLNSVLLALVEWRLYPSGPGPEPIWIDKGPQLPRGRAVHPVTGEPALRKLMISLPPRIGKSWFLGEMFSAWYLTKYPDDTIMYASHGAAISKRFSKRARKHVMSHPEFGTLLDETSQSVEEWNLEDHDGGFLAFGLDGVKTGRGGNVLVDDPFKKGEDTLNDEQREKKWEAYKSDIRDRVEYGCWEIVNGTRWHDLDIHGHLKESEPGEWFEVNIPAIAWEDEDEDGFSIDPETNTRDVLNRKPGEAICPELAPAEFYLKQRDLFPYWFDAKFMGKPSGIGGNFFRTFNYYKRHIIDEEMFYESIKEDGTSEFVSEKDCVRFGVVDLAISQKQTADWTVFGVFDLDPWYRIYLREIIRERVSGPDHDDFIRSNAALWDCRIVGIEDKTYGTRAIQEIVEEGGLNIYPLKADDAKEIRAIPAANYFKRGLFLIDRNAAWKDAYVAEHEKFPKGAHDDQVDVTAYAVRMREWLTANPLPKTTERVKTTTMDDILLEATTLRPKKNTETGLVIGN